MARAKAEPDVHTARVEAEGAGIFLAVWQPVIGENVGTLNDSPPSSKGSIRMTSWRETVEVSATCRSRDERSLAPARTRGRPNRDAECRQSAGPQRGRHRETRVTAPTCRRRRVGTFAWTEHRGTSEIRPRGGDIDRQSMVPVAFVIVPCKKSQPASEERKENDISQTVLSGVEKCI
jgi:hypothetical protein